MSQKYSARPLPYSTDALAAKGMSRETVEFHYGKHHLGYVTRLNAMAAADPKNFEGWTIERFCRTPSKVGSVAYNMAAQIFNHDFYWQSLSPSGGGQAPSGSAIGRQIEKDFDSFEKFAARFTAEAAGHFGSGWAWLVYDRAAHALKVVGTHDAICPLTIQGAHYTPILVCDVWEHAYYIDVRNDRAKFIETWWKLVNWEFAERNLAAAQGPAKL